MTRDNNMNEYEDVEQILRPKCEFHVSSGFRESLMKETDIMTAPMRRRLKLWLVSAGVAAAIAAVVYIGFSFLPDGVVAPGEKIIASADTIVTETVKLCSIPSFQDQTAIAQAIDPKRNEIHNAGESDGTPPGVGSTKLDSNGRKTQTGHVNRRNEMNRRSETKDADKMLAELGIIRVDDQKSEHSADIESISLSNENMRLTEEEKLKVRRIEEMEYIEKLRLKVEITTVLIRDLNKSNEYR